MAVERRGRNGWLSTITNQYYPTEQAANEAETAFKESGTGKTIDKLTQQILGQGTTSQWSGEGFGSAEANARDMAKILADTGITDIKQFGKWTVEEPYTYPIDEYGGTATEMVKREVFGNKDTKQTVARTYASDPTAWGGTYAGKGNTGYRVQFAPDGMPYFYTTGASSSDLGKIAPILGLGMMFIPGLQGLGASIGSALGASGATAAALGNAIIQGTLAEASGGDFLKGAVAGAAGSLVPGVQSELANTFGGGTAANIAAGALTGGTMAELTGGDFTQGALVGGIGSGINQAKLSAAEDYLQSLPTEGYNVATAPTEADILDVIAAQNPASFKIGDTTFTPDYSLGRGTSGAPGLTVAPIDTQYQVGSFDYSLGELIDGLGLKMPSTPNIDAMGGGQGIVIKTTDGYITESGFVPNSYVASLGDPESFINKPVVDVQLSLSELQNTSESDLNKKLAGLDIAKALTPYALAALTKKAFDQSREDGAASGFAIVPVPADWKSPEYNMAFTPSAPIDFGSRELLRGTQWENPMTLSNLVNTLNTQSQPFMQSNISTPEMPDILQQFNVAPTVGLTDTIGNLNGNPVSIADIISGIQSGQNYSS